jgi:hypothetical protein
MMVMLVPYLLATWALVNEPEDSEVFVEMEEEELDLIAPLPEAANQDVLPMHFEAEPPSCPCFNMDEIS